jgi:hypothetical protein
MKRALARDPEPALTLTISLLDVLLYSRSGGVFDKRAGGDMQPAEAAHYIRQVAMTGLPPSASIPLMMRALEYVVRSQNNPFSWTEPDGMPSHVWLPDIEPYAFEAAFAETFADRGPDAPTIDKLTGGPRPFNNTADVYRLPRWQKCALKNELLRYYQAEQSCDFAVRDRGVLKASFSISRSEGSTPFTMKEMRRVLALVPYFLHALNAPYEPDGKQDDHAVAPHGPPAQLVVAHDGTVVAFGHKGEEYLFKLADPVWSEQPRIGDLLSRLPARLSGLIARLNPLSQVPPSQDVRSRWGEFRVMAHPLTKVMESVPELAMITIQPLIPLSAHYFRILSRYRLTPSERRTAVLMAEPGQAQEIAAKAGLTLDSYRQVAKRIYAALEVSGREEVKHILAL